MVNNIFTFLLPRKSNILAGIDSALNFTEVVCIVVDIREFLKQLIRLGLRGGRINAKLN